MSLPVPVSPALMAAGVLGSVGLHSWQDGAAAVAVFSAFYWVMARVGRRTIVKPIKAEIAMQTSVNNELLRKEILSSQDQMRREVNERHADNKKYIDEKVKEITDLVKRSTQTLKDGQP